MQVRFHEAASRDAQAALLRYRLDGGPLVGAAFASAAREAAALVSLYPLLGSPYADNTRRFPLRRFPFSLIYRAIDDELQIIAVAHHARKPTYWRTRT